MSKKKSTADPSIGVIEDFSSIDKTVDYGDEFWHSVPVFVERVNWFSPGVTYEKGDGGSQANWEASQISSVCFNSPFVPMRYGRYYFANVSHKEILDDVAGRVVIRMLEEYGDYCSLHEYREIIVSEAKKAFYQIKRSFVENENFDTDFGDDSGDEFFRTHLSIEVSYDLAVEEGAISEESTPIDVVEEDALSSLYADYLPEEIRGSERYMAIIYGIIHNKTKKEVAASLGISERTVIRATNELFDKYVTGE